jgi:hypothetical protein
MPGGGCRQCCLPADPGRTGKLCPGKIAWEICPYRTIHAQRGFEVLDFLALFLGPVFSPFFAEFFPALAVSIARRARAPFAFFFTIARAISPPVMGLLDSAGDASTNPLNCSRIDFFAMFLSLWSAATSFTFKRRQSRPLVMPCARTGVTV